jgi:DME family drug/metabolite transporter
VTGWLIILYLGAIPTALAYGLFVFGMRTTPAPLASILVLLEPLTAALLSWWIFGERLSPAAIIGAMLVLGAVYALSTASR